MAPPIEAITPALTARRLASCDVDDIHDRVEWSKGAPSSVLAIGTMSVLNAAEALLLAFSALVLHLMSLTGIVGAYRVLPMRWLESFWREGGYAHPPGFLRSAGVAVATLFGLLATFMSALLIGSGGIATALGVVELVGVVHG